MSHPLATDGFLALGWEFAFHLVVDLAGSREVGSLLAVADVERAWVAEEGVPEQGVVALAAEQRVVAEVAGEVVVAVPTVDGVVRRPAEQVVIAAVTQNVVGSGLPGREVLIGVA